MLSFYTLVAVDGAHDQLNNEDEMQRRIDDFTHDQGVTVLKCYSSEGYITFR